MVVFFLAVLAITLATARPNIMLDGRREKEIEMIWRGKQYVRGIRLYYKKLHHFPTQLDDLYTAKTGIRFMRTPYKDPMNTVDGTWRLIYAGSSGQILGSLTQPSISVMPGATPASAFNDPFSGSSASSFGGAKNPFPGPGGTSSFSFSSVTSNDCQPTSKNPASSSQTLDAPNLPNSQTPQCSNAPQTAADPQDPSLPNAQNAIIGVGSKINKNSIIWLKGQKNYLHFEFIWKAETADPSTVVPNP
jgi:hypothetical protein